MQAFESSTRSVHDRRKTLQRPLFALVVWISASLGASQTIQGTPQSSPPSTQALGGSFAGMPFPKLDARAPIDVMWVETNGAAFGRYDSTDRYKDLVTAMNNRAAVNLTIKSSGTITLAELSTFDLVIVPSLANYNFAWTAAEVTAFVDYATAGGCLYIWTDNPNTQHLSVDPILAQVGLSRTGGLLPNDIWDVTQPGHTTRQMWGLVGGAVQGGTPWLVDGGLTAGTRTAVGSGEVLLLGDCNVYAEQLQRLDNSRMLKVMVKSCL